MLICPRCDMEYDQGESACGACGSPLVFREDPKPEFTQPTPGKRELRICPKCNLLYEKRTHCMSCGTALVAQSSSPVEKEAPRTSDLPDKKEPSPVQPSRKQPEKPREEPVCPSCKTAYEPGGFCKKCGRRQVTHDLPDQQQAPRPAREPQVRNRNSGKDLQQILEGFYPQATREESIIPKPFLLGAIILVVLVVGYFPVKRAMVANPTAAPATSPIITTSPRIEISTAATAEASTEEQEGERIKGLLEDIRQANLREDIDLFMSCYAADFKGREKKKRSILESWKHSDYLDLSYRLKSRALTVDTAKIQVEWLVRTARSTTGQLEEGELLVEALLKKESGIWKIKEIKTLS